MFTRHLPEDVREIDANPESLQRASSLLVPCVDLSGRLLTCWNCVQFSPQILHPSGERRPCPHSSPLDSAYIAHPIFRSCDAQCWILKQWTRCSRRQQTSPPVLPFADLDQTTSFDVRLVPPSGELDEYASSLILAHSLHYMKTTSSTKPEVYNVSHCCQRIIIIIIIYTFV